MPSPAPSSFQNTSVSLWLSYFTCKLFLYLSICNENDIDVKSDRGSLMTQSKGFSFAFTAFQADITFQHPNLSTANTTLFKMTQIPKLPYILMY